MKSQHDQYLDFLKGIAVLGVVLVHYCQYWKGTLPAAIADVGKCGQFFVQMFFVISGYLAFVSIKKNPKSFLYRRMIRVLPVCYIAYCGEVAIQSVRGGVSIWDIITAFTFTNGFSPYYINSIGKWYIGTIFVFYICLPVISRLVTDLKRAYLFLFMSTAFCIFLDRIISIYIISIHPNAEGFFYYWLPRQFPVILLGIVIYFIKDHENKKDNVVFHFILLISTWFMISIGIDDLRNPHLLFGIISYFLIVNGIDISMPDKYKIIYMLGKNSLAMYMFHPLILTAINVKYIDIFNKLKETNIPVFFILYVAVVLCTFIVSLIVSIFVERPFENFVKKINYRVGVL